MDRKYRRNRIGGVSMSKLKLNHLAEEKRGNEREKMTRRRKIILT